MKTKWLFASVACMLLAFSLTVVAQESVPPLPEDPDWNVNKIIVNRVVQKALEGDASGLFAMMVLAPPGGSPFPDIAEEFGITGEQIVHMRELMEVAGPEDFHEIAANVLTPMAHKAMNDADYVLTDEEGAAIDWLVTAMFDAGNSTMAETLTDEQIQKMDGMLLALTGGLESPFFNDRHMAALDMTNEQKEKFKAINESMKAGREKMVDECVTKVGEMLKSGKFEFSKLTAVLATFRGYSKELGQLRRTVLTDAQIAKARTLSRLPRSLSFTNLLPQWTPGPGSWQPGDPIPEEYRQQRNRGSFPRPKN